MKRVRNTEQFISRSREIHHDIFDYSKVVYVKSRIPVKIGCRRCGDIFPQTPHEHLGGKGCPSCRTSSRSIESTESFVSKLKTIHGADRYDYNRSIYTGLRFAMIVDCNRCGESFTRAAYKHILGYGCPTCYRVPDQTMKNRSFIVRATSFHSDGMYDYSHVQYRGAKTKVMIGCVRCKRSFEQTPDGHLCGHGCGHCGNGAQWSTEDYIAKSIRAYGTDRYDYSKVCYTGATNPVEVGCLRCGLSFQVVARSHSTQGVGCPHCVNKTETKLYEWLLAKYPQYTIERQHRLSGQRYETGRHRNRYDFLISELRLIIELDGEQHFVKMWHWDSSDKTRRRDAAKMVEANQEGFSIVRILQREVWTDEVNWEAKLTDAIRVYPVPTNIFLHETKYAAHQSQLYWAAHLYQAIHGNPDPWYETLRRYIVGLGLGKETVKLHLSNNEESCSYIVFVRQLSQTFSTGSVIDDLRWFLVAVLGIASEITMNEQNIIVTMDAKDSIYHRFVMTA